MTPTYTHQATYTTTIYIGTNKQALSLRRWGVTQADRV